MPEVEFDVDMEDQGDAVPLQKMYVCEKDSKSVLVYDLGTNRHERKNIQMDTQFLHNFQYCQTRSGRLFVLGGGDFKKPEAASLKQCFEVLVKDGGETFKISKKKEMALPRHGHSVCAIQDRFLVVTGSRIETNDSS